jgi:hypothetical protein
MVLRVIAVIMIFIGTALIITGNQQRSSVELGDDNWFEESSGGSQKMGIGIAMIMFATFLLLVSFARKTSSYMAVETAPAVKISSEAVGHGISEGIQKGGGIRVQLEGISGRHYVGKEPIEIIKIKCRNCGYLETEDAEFYSKCGKRV